MTPSSETTPEARSLGPGRIAVLRRLAPLGLFALIGWLCFPGSYDVAGTGLDPSWVVGVNLFAHRGFQFGHDVVFTYGPLGFLTRPLDIGHHLVIANWTRVLVFLATLGGAALLLREPNRRPSVWLFLGFFPLSIMMGRDLDYEMVGLIVLLCSLAVTERIGWLFVPAAALAALLPWVKFGTFLCAAATLGLALVLWLFLHRRWREVAVSMAVYLLTFGVLARALVGSLAGLGEFLRTSWEIASGYNTSMVTIGANDTVVAAIIVLLLLGAVAAWLVKTRSREVVPLAIGSVSVLYAWKHSFVRQDPGHAAIFFTVALWCLLVCLLFSEERRTRLVWTSLLVVPLACAGSATIAPSLRDRVPVLVDVLTGGRGARNLHAFLHPAEVRRALQKQARENLASDILPTEWLKTIGHEPVLVVPWEISLCLANDLRCVPYPTLQMYSTYTRSLDAWTARRLREVSPRFVIASVGAIDERNMIWDCPRTWVTLFQGWEVIRQDNKLGYLLLARRPTPGLWEEREVSRAEGKVGAWVPLPPRKVPLRARLFFRESWRGALERSIWRSRPVTLETMSENGRRQVYRLVVETAADGLLIDADPANATDLAGLVNCCAVRERASAIRVTGPGARSLRPEFTVVWSEVTTGYAFAVLPPAPVADAPVVPGYPFLAIDALNMKHFDSSRLIRIDPTLEDMVILTGWAADREAHAPASAVFIRVDGGRLDIPAAYGTARDDVAEYFKEPGYARIGYRGVVSLDELGHGRHTVQVRVVSSDGQRSQLSSPIELDVR
jgi:hypothetical protein